MRITNTINPPMEDVLEHYGVKGMRWGVRRSDAQLAKSRGSKTQEIKDARRRVRSKGAKNLREYDARKAAAKSDIKKAREEYLKAKRTGEREIRNAKGVLFTKNSRINSTKDARIASQMTRGEKAALALSVPASAASAVMGAPYAPLATVVGAQAVGSANIRRKMRRGDYDD